MTIEIIDRNKGIFEPIKKIQIQIKNEKDPSQSFTIRDIDDVVAVKEVIHFVIQSMIDSDDEFVTSRYKNILKEVKNGKETIE